MTNTNELNEWNLYLLNDYVSRYNYSYIDNTHLENNQKIFKDEECYFYRRHGQGSINGIDFYSFTYDCDKTIDGKKYEMEDIFEIYTSSKVDMYDNFEISIKITDELNNKEEYSIRLQIYEKN